MNKLFQNVDFFQGLNMNPISFEFGQEMNTTKFLHAMQAKLTEIINICNTVLESSENYTNDEISLVKELLYNSNKLNAKFIEDKSVTLSKLSDESISNLNSRIMSYIGSTIKTVQFGLNDEGYFTADIPETWKEINFSTDVEGHLMIETI
jgi:hypothetical protein